MKKFAPEEINAAFLNTWREFGDNKSTEFLVQVTSERLKITPSAVYDGLEAFSRSAQPPAHSATGAD